jgi:hypothetical protein
MPRLARPPATSSLPALLTIALVALAACGGGSAFPVVSFDPASACTSDGRMPGAYPDLEARLPADYEGRAPDNVDSGRSCTDEALGTLAGAGIEEPVRGRDMGSRRRRHADRGHLRRRQAEAGGDDRVLRVERHTTADREGTRTRPWAATGRRLDVLQAMAPARTREAARRGDRLVNVLLAADVGDTKVLEALAAFGR